MVDVTSHLNQLNQKLQRWFSIFTLRDGPSGGFATGLKRYSNAQLAYLITFTLTKFTKFTPLYLLIKNLEFRSNQRF